MAKDELIMILIEELIKFLSKFLVYNQKNLSDYTGMPRNYINRLKMER